MLVKAAVWGPAGNLDLSPEGIWCLRTLVVMACWSCVIRAQEPNTWLAMTYRVSYEFVSINHESLYWRVFVLFCFLFWLAKLSHCASMVEVGSETSGNLRKRFLVWPGVSRPAPQMRRGVRGSDQELGKWKTRELGVMRAQDPGNVEWREKNELEWTDGLSHCYKFIN